MQGTENAEHPWLEYCLLGLLALFWGSSYLFIKVALVDLPPLTLIAIRVSGAAVLLTCVVIWRGYRFPTDPKAWRSLLVQSALNAFVPWTILAWGQQFVDAALASVLNSTSPIFVLIFTALVTRHEVLGATKYLGVALGLGGVVFVVGIGALGGLGDQVAGQLACLFAAALYGCAAIYGKRFGHQSPSVTAAGTMICSSAVLVPAALWFDRPWELSVSLQAAGAAAMLSIFCTGFALLLYFRLVKTIGSLGVASQAYLRSGFGVLLGIILLGETLSLPVAVGLMATIAGVVLINLPSRKHPEAGATA
jgi:drug/metabolite transporter (DMT)-like permease